MKKYLTLLGLSYSLLLNAQTMETQKMTTMIEGKDVRLFTTLYPKENAETVILLHGGPGVPDDMLFVAGVLKEQYQVISFHQRGTARSPVAQPDFSIKSYLDDIDSVAAFFHVEKFHLFGHSWGGLYAQIYAEKNPNRILSLFLSSPGSGTGYQWKQTEKEVMAFNRSKLSWIKWLLMGWNSFRGMMGSDAAYRKVFSLVLRNYNDGFINAGTGSMDLNNLKAKPINHTRKELYKYPLLLAKAQLGFNVTITYGDKDIYGNSKKYIADRFPSASIFTIENSGHLPQQHNPAGLRLILQKHFQIANNAIVFEN
jgi:proline iminopeptidase